MLDPRRKMLLTNFLFLKIYGEKAKFEIKMICKLFVNLIHKYEVTHSSNSSGWINDSANSQVATAGDSIMLDSDMNKMVDEWASSINENT